MEETKKPRTRKEKQIASLYYQIKENIPISQVLGHHGVKVERVSGINKLALCPFHPDENLGSFTINDNMGICKCFACGQGGDAVKFIEITQHKTRTESIVTIAVEEGLISKIEGDLLANVKYEPMTTNENESFSIKKRELNDEEIELRHNVYSLFPMIFGLNDNHYKQLKEKRKLSDERISRDYFSFESKSYGRDEVKKLSKLVDLDPEHLPPGFYVDKRSGKIELAIYEGIGMLIRNIDQKVIGIQIRTNNEDKRYIWLTSSFALTKYNGDSIGGSSPGTPLDVIIPEKQTGKYAIVEGKFKAEILAQQGFTAFSVQGVGNFAGIENEITMKDGTFYVFYDGDMLSNVAVLKQTSNLCRYLKEVCPNLKVYVCMWDENLGKGIDDLIFNGNKEKIRIIPSKDFDPVWTEVLDDFTSKNDIESYSKLSKEERKEFNKKLSQKLKIEYKITT